MTFTRTFAPLLVPVTLAACGGTTTQIVPENPDPPAPTTQEVARADVASASVFSDWVEVGDTRTVLRTRPSDGDTTTYALTLEDVDALDGSGFASFSDSDSGPRWRTFEAKGPGGAVARITGFVDDRVNLSYAPQSEFITTGGSIPLAGTATYSGDYVGMLTLGSGTLNPNYTSNYVTGDVSITADFGNEVLDGRISNRTAYRTATDSEVFDLADVTLRRLALTGGRSNAPYGGGTTGGTIQASGYTPQNSTISGSWNAAASGDTAEAITGSVFINHAYTGTTRDQTEAGVFVTTQD